MMTQPQLSIVTPTREGFSQHWLTELLKIRGDVEFILVHPPGYSPNPVADLRLQQIVSPIRGEIIQRLTGLFNAKGKYILTINCDEYITPDILSITVAYFEKFPESWVFRLRRKSFDFDDKVSLEQPWLSVGEIENWPLQPMPIAPIDNPLDLGLLWRDRLDHHGRHTENFDKKVWQNHLVQASIVEIAQLFSLIGPVKYIPFWCLDRFLGLFIQAKFYQKNKIIGHVFCDGAEQIRIEANPPEYRKKMRFYFLAEILLIKHFPRSGYFWNLNISQIKAVPTRAIGFLGRNLFKNKTISSKLETSK